MEPERLGALLDRLGPGLALFARQWCDCPEDVVQEAFLALASRRDEPAVPSAWLYQAVRRGAINAGIADQRRRRRETAVGSRLTPWFVPDGSKANEVDPEAAQAALADLPAAQREVIVAHLWGKLTFEEVADLVGSSPSSAHRLYQSGLTILRARLGVLCRSKTTPRRPT